jgi:hypothetical protein
MPTTFLSDSVDSSSLQDVHNRCVKLFVIFVMRFELRELSPTEPADVQ